LLEHARRIDHQDARGFAQRRPDLSGQFADHRLPLPRLLANELLQRLPVLLVQVRDRLDVLAFDIGDQAGHVFLQMRALRGVFQACRKGPNKLFQPPQHALQRLGLHLRLRHQFLVTHRKSPFHGLLLSIDSIQRKDFLQNNLHPIKINTQSN